MSYAYYGQAVHAVGRRDIRGQGEVRVPIDVRYLVFILYLQLTTSPFASFTPHPCHHIILAWLI